MREGSCAYWTRPASGLVLRVWYGTVALGAAWATRVESRAWRGAGAEQRTSAHVCMVTPVATARFLALLLPLMDAPHVGLRCAAVDVVTEILAKRMEPLPKLNLIQVCVCVCV